VLSHRLPFLPAEDAALFAEVPASAAVFALRGEGDTEPYISKTANLRRRLQRLLGPPTEHSKKLNLRDRVRWVEYSPAGSDFESGFLLYRVLRAAFPKAYGNRLRLRFAPLVKLHLDNEYPRASLTTRMSGRKSHSLYYGPFPSRVAAEKFASDSLDFFKMRRCVEDLYPDPQFPGCIYSEMKMCLAPCFKGCTNDEYSQEVARVQAYFDSGGESLVREIAAQRDEASTNLEFENAAALHARLDKLKPLLAQLPEIVRRTDHLHGVMVQRSAVPGAVNFFRIDAGAIFGPVAFPIQHSEHAKSQSMEARVQESLAAIPAAKPRSALEAMEHMALLKRWYYRGSRTGEIFLVDEKGEFPMRRLVRGISRVYRGEKAENAGASAGPAIIQPSTGENASLPKS
jgi:excinuclease UvrABC nuclease subunit